MTLTERRYSAKLEAAKVGRAVLSAPRGDGASSFACGAVRTPTPYLWKPRVPFAIIRVEVRVVDSLVVAAVCDRRKRRSQSAATARRLEATPLPKCVHPGRQAGWSGSKCPRVRVEVCAYQGRRMRLSGWTSGHVRVEKPACQGGQAGWSGRNGATVRVGKRACPSGYAHVSGWKCPVVRVDRCAGQGRLVRTSGGFARSSGKGCPRMKPMTTDLRLPPPPHFSVLAF